MIDGRSEAGVTLIELLVAMSILVVVLLATFAAFDGFGRATRANFKQNHAQSVARNTADRMARAFERSFEELLTSGPIGNPVKPAGSDRGGR